MTLPLEPDGVTLWTRAKAQARLACLTDLHSARNVALGNTTSNETTLVLSDYAEMIVAHPPSDEVDSTGFTIMREE